jgi:hypothetical protein
MNKAGLYSLLAVILVVMAASMKFDSRALDAALGSAMAIGGSVLLITDPKTAESRRIGYRTMGITLLTGGILVVLLAMYRKFLMPRFF